MPRAPILTMVLPGKHPGHRRKYIELIYTTVPQPVLFRAVEHNGALNYGWLFTFCSRGVVLWRGFGRETCRVPCFRSMKCCSDDYQTRAERMLRSMMMLLFVQGWEDEDEA
jgi:hypothetical protein